MIYEFADRLLFFLTDGLSRVGGAMWVRFLGLTLVGKAVTVVALAYAAAWAGSRIGEHSLARELVHVGWTFMSLVLAWLVIRHIWRRFMRPSRFRW